MNQSKVVLFMKGDPNTPRCGFSRQTVGILNEQGIEFSHFDILTDESVRQGELSLTRTSLSNLADDHRNRTQKSEQLANIPAVDHQWRICRWFGHREGDGREWGAQRDGGLRASFLTAIVIIFAFVGSPLLFAL